MPSTMVAPVAPVLRWYPQVVGAPSVVYAEGTLVDNGVLAGVISAAAASSVGLTVGSLTVPTPWEPNSVLTEAVADSRYMVAGGPSWPSLQQTTLLSATAAIWTSVDPTLAVNQVGLETDTGNTKIGDGVTPWISLGYSTTGTNSGIMFAPKAAGTSGGGGDEGPLNAAITAAAAANRTLVFGDGNYWAAGTTHWTCSFTMGPNTVIKAATGFTGVLADTPFGTAYNELTFSGGIFDGNNTAQHAFWAHQVTHCGWLNKPIFRNSVQDDFVMGDPADSGFSYGNYMDRPCFDRTIGGAGFGFANLWLSSFSSDCIISCPRGNGQEIGVRNDGGDNTVEIGHFSNSQLTAFLDTGSGNKWRGCIPDTPINKTHSGASATNGSSTVLDANACSSYVGLLITSAGGGIPTNTYIASVSVGVSYTIGTNLGAPVTTTAAVSGITLIGCGFNFQGSAAVYIEGSYAPYSTANGTTFTNTNPVVIVGPNIPYCKVDNLYAWSQDTSHQWGFTIVGKVSILDYLGLTEVRINTPLGITNKLNSLTQGVFATIGNTWNTQTIVSGNKFQCSTTRNNVLFVPVTTAGTLTITMGISTGAENPITGGSITFSQGCFSFPVPAAIWVIITVGTAVLGTLEKMTI